MRDSSFMEWVIVVLVLSAIAIGAIFGLDALGLIPSDPVGGFIGISLGVLVLLGANWLVS